jgi:hypothetical protein
MKTPATSYRQRRTLLRHFIINDLLARGLAAGVLKVELMRWSREHGFSINALRRWYCAARADLAAGPGRPEEVTR